MRPKNEPGIPRWRGEALRLRRIAAGMTLQDVAEAIEVSRTTVARWEANTNAPTHSAVRAMSDLFGVSMRSFSRMPKVS